MSIATFLKRITNDTAVYWPTPVPAADGSNTFGSPIEIRCFWEATTNLILEIDSKEIQAQARVHVVIDLAEQGMLFHGELSDLTNPQQSDPRKAPRAYEIKKFIKTPSLNIKGQFNRVALI